MVIVLFRSCGGSVCSGVWQWCIQQITCRCVNSSSCNMINVSVCAEVQVTNLFACPSAAAHSAVCCSFACSRWACPLWLPQARPQEARPVCQPKSGRHQQPQKAC
jgi:hypothetical protein